MAGAPSIGQINGCHAHGRVTVVQGRTYGCQGHGGGTLVWGRTIGGMNGAGSLWYGAGIPWHGAGPSGTKCMAGALWYRSGTMGANCMAGAPWYGSKSIVTMNMAGSSWYGAGPMDARLMLWAPWYEDGSMGATHMAGSSWYGAGPMGARHMPGASWREAPCEASGADGASGCACGAARQRAGGWERLSLDVYYSSAASVACHLFPAARLAGGSSRTGLTRPRSCCHTWTAIGAGAAPAWHPPGDWVGFGVDPLSPGRVFDGVGGVGASCGAIGHHHGDGPALLLPSLPRLAPVPCLFSCCWSRIMPLPPPARSHACPHRAAPSPRV